MTLVEAQSTPTPIVVLASGVGSLLQAIINAQGASYQVVAVVCDRQCPAVDIAAAHNIPAQVHPLVPGADRDRWNEQLADMIAAYSPQLVVSAGFMKILGSAVINRFPRSIINTHPALLPKFPGAHAVRDALEAQATETGCTVHIVDEGVDTGPVIAQRVVPIVPGDTEASLHERIKTEERALIVEVLSGDISWQ
ncbi:phosphoribosylglycinamide formyltransferase [Corynebacterium choanae]|uniref:Phosphoribosylglycinamide formyltransferase n=1 Tax=Corynebacterium choanae TaxID=1862358 RepID=A0A3G6J9E2_9CORY|nr:phosphoribosylglycinamide formyltransferase [Corynebacterium choanae]AZA13070.1 Phosphoribosylglycinamide formyltransferase [Corynebacterium choanae]